MYIHLYKDGVCSCVKKTECSVYEYNVFGSVKVDANIRTFEAIEGRIEFTKVVMYEIDEFGVEFFFAVYSNKSV